MLYRTFFYFIFFMLPVVCGAQVNNFFATEDDATPRTFYGGLTGGLNFSQVDGDTYAGYSKVGWNGGGVVYARLTDHFGFSMELIYTQKGSRSIQYMETAGAVPYINNYTLKLNYAEVPVMIYVAPHCLSSRFHFRAGVSYGQLINYSETALTYTAVNLDPKLYPFHQYDIDYLADLDYMFYKGWFLNFRYSYSLTSIRDAQDIPPGYGYGAKGQYNNFFTLRLMYLIK
jgi:hypothetical protein